MKTVSRINLSSESSIPKRSFSKRSMAWSFFQNKRPKLNIDQPNDENDIRNLRKVDTQ